MKSKPRSKPRNDEDLAFHLCQAIRDATAHMQCRGACWVSLSAVNRRLRLDPTDLDHIVRCAVSAEWVETNGSDPPHSVCLFRGAWQALRERAA